MNYNLLIPTGFQFQCERLPSTTFFIQSVVLPGLNMGATMLNTPLKNVPIPGDKVEYEDLQITFKVDEDMTAYYDIWKWIIEIGFPRWEDFPGYPDSNSLNRDPLTSPATLTILNNNKLPNVRMKFDGLFPISLSGIQMDTRDMNAESIEATATFRYMEQRLELGSTGSIE